MITSNLKIAYPDLPVVEHREEFFELLEKHQVVIVKADTGSGKSTQLPKFLLEWFTGKNAGAVDGGENALPFKIGVTEPRRLAAISIADRLREELKDETLVSTKIRFWEQGQSDAPIKVMTDGILLQEFRRVAVPAGTSVEKHSFHAVPPCAGKRIPPVARAGKECMQPPCHSRRHRNRFRDLASGILASTLPRSMLDAAAAAGRDAGPARSGRKRARPAVRAVSCQTAVWSGMVVETCLPTARPPGRRPWRSRRCPRCRRP